MSNTLLTFHSMEPGIYLAQLNITALYPDPAERKRFEERFSLFYDSDPIHAQIFCHDGSYISYQTECIIPVEEDDRPPLLLVFGNPASHSAAAGMFFSFERNGHEHRIWKSLYSSGLLAFPFNYSTGLEEQNRLKKEHLFNLQYDSQFRIGFAVYYSMPTSASKTQWSGVDGVKRLFGKRALEKIAACESLRLERIVRQFVSPNGAIIAFQKDAYTALKAASSPEYALSEARVGRLVGRCRWVPDVKLFCTPPTRNIQGKASLDLLRSLPHSILRAGGDA